MPQFIIKPLTLQDADSSAKLHQEGMPKDFLPSFGFEFLKKLHQAIIINPEVISLGCFDKNQLIGILIGSRHTRNLFRQIFRHYKFKLLPHVLTQTFRHPLILKKFLQTFIYGVATPRTIPAEIIILSISENYRRRGIANKLFKSLIDKYKELKVSVFIVGTTVENEPANNFYVKVGGQYIKKFDIYNRTWNIYVFNIKNL